MNFNAKSKQEANHLSLSNIRARNKNVKKFVKTNVDFDISIRIEAFFKDKLSKINIFLLNEGKMLPH